MTKLRIGVIGDSGKISEEVRAMAEEVGREIAASQSLLLTGGRDGVMAAASKGATEAGGTAVGILPGDDPDLGNEYLDIPITTGLGFDYRSNILIHSSDALIMIGGGNGTLGELSLSYLNRCPAVILEKSGGWSQHIRDLAYQEKYLDQRASIEINYAASAAEAVEMACRLAR